MIEKPLDQIAVADLQALVAEQRPEGRRLDYKRDLPDLGKEESKREIARDVSAFANGAGGDLIFGIEEAKDAAGKNLGRAGAVVGVACDNFDQLKLRLESILASHIEPRVQGIAFHEVVDASFVNGPVIVIRIPRSWNAPHMIATSTPTFWTRSNSGRQALDVHEIRAAFIAGTEAATRVKRFRDERIGKIIAGETPVPLRSRGDAKVVLHVVPVGRDVFDRPPDVGIEV